MIYDVVVCGGGAAGFFSAINITLKVPHSKVLILEKSQKLLSKVKISGGGRCNVTNGRESVGELVKFYPRGQKKLYQHLKNFGSKEMKHWLSEHGVAVKTEEDLRVFPTTNSSQTIIDCFLRLCQKHHVEIKTGHEVTGFREESDYWMIATNKGHFKSRYIVFATGASPKSWSMLQNNELQVTELVPSLFTFNVKDPRIEGLQGLSFKAAEVRIEGTKLSEKGPLLLTHWGLSGPAILKLSAWGARTLHHMKYQFNVMINFNHAKSFEHFREQLQHAKEENPQKKLLNLVPDDMPSRFWQRLVSYCGIDENIQMKDLTKKSINKLSEESTQGKFTISGKSTFKEEFVTCGGIKLTELDLKTMESKHHKGVYMCGELLDIDGITGGFNFQACWATGWAVSESIAAKLLS